MAKAPQDTDSQRLSDLRSARPYDATLQNLLFVVTAKLDLSARLPIFEYEAQSEGFPETASYLGAMASAERESLQDLLNSLRCHLDAHSSRRFAPGTRA